MCLSITPAAIADACRTAAAASVRIDVVAQTGSTNADLLARANNARSVDTTNAVPSLPGPTLLVALAQTAGRGRAGRAWQSNLDSLAFSLAWPFSLPVSGLLGLPLAVGVAVAEVLAARQVKVSLKWPNDILLEGRKLAGILIESTSSGTAAGRGRRQTWAVIGIGMNLFPAGSNERLIDVPASAALPATDRNVLLAELLDAIVSNLQQFERAGLAPFVARWNALHAHAGRQVDIIDRGKILASGAALGVDASGRLLLDAGTPALAQVVAIVAGDVSLRPHQGAAHAIAD